MCIKDTVNMKPRRRGEVEKPPSFKIGDKRIGTMHYEWLILILIGFMVYVDHKIKTFENNPL